ncbi:MAG: GNAT family N-acetyltransferase [Eubacterium sp.]
MIRKLTFNDFEIIDNIIAQLHKIHFENRPDFYLRNEHPISKKEYKALLKNQNKINIAYVVENEIVGICLATIKDKMVKSIYIDDLFVIEPFRQQGIATKLYKQVESIAKDIGAKRIDLTVWQFNKTAMNFYKSLGMETQRIILETRLE